MSIDETFGTRQVIDAAARQTKLAVTRLDGSCIGTWFGVSRV
ncbi:MAG TPA: hypothetical protein VMM78_02445 [Thermomicrobiales bacterium]|nr:hypothetical protein [Thermomicrobiales bacterium]